MTTIKCTLCNLLLTIVINCSVLKFDKINEYETDNKTYWKSLSKFEPIVGSSYGTIQLRKEMEIKFKLICHSVKHDHPNNDFENILRIGMNGLDYGCHVHGSRYPAIYIDTKLMKFEFCISDTRSCWRQYPLLPLHIGSVYHFALQFNETKVKIEYESYKKDNNELITRGVIYEGNREGMTNIHHLCRYHDIIISDPLNIAADVQLWDIEIKSFDTNLYCKQWEKYKNMHHEL